MSETYEEFKSAVKDEQSSMTKDEVRELMQKRSEYLVDLENTPSQQHRWVDRGLVMSCEGAGHPNHRSFKAVR